MISLYILVIRRRVLVPIVLCLTWLAVFGLVLAGLLPERRVIVIDPGHGGIDGGTSSGDLLEKDVNLRMGHILREVLEARQYQVVMTRTDDSDVSHFVPNGASRYRRDLKGRVRLVGGYGPSAISIHVNWHKELAPGCHCLLSKWKQTAACWQRLSKRSSMLFSR